MNIIDLFFKGGIVMYPILLCSIFVVAIFLYKFFEYKKIFNIFSLSFQNRLKTDLLKPFNEFILSKKNEEELKILWTKTIYDIEKGLSWLGLLASISTLLGLLGTVTGMIKTFMVISKISNPQPQLLAGGIWEAMITTAFGLFVAIPAHIGLHYLENKCDEISIIIGQFIEELKKNGPIN